MVFYSLPPRCGILLSLLTANHHLALPHHLSCLGRCLSISLSTVSKGRLFQIRTFGNDSSRFGISSHTGHSCLNNRRVFHSQVSSQHMSGQRSQCNILWVYCPNHYPAWCRDLLDHSRVLAADIPAQRTKDAEETNQERSESK